MYWVENEITGHKRTGNSISSKPTLISQDPTTELVAYYEVLNYFFRPRNIKRNTLEKMMEWDEDGPLQKLDLQLPGRSALGFSGQFM